MNMADIASRLAEVRRRSGIGVRGFAAALEQGANYSVSHTSVNQYESGTTVPAAYVAAVCRSFGIDSGWLLTGEGTPDLVQPTAIERAFEEIGRLVAGVYPVPLTVETQWEAFFRLSPDPFCILTADGYGTKLNPAWEAVLGHALVDLTEQCLLDLMPAEDVIRVRGVLELLSRQGGTLRFESRMRSASGAYRSFSWSATSAGGLIFAVARDTTELKAAEERVRRSEASLATAQRIARLGNWDWWIETNSLYWSKEIFRIFGLSQGDFEETYPAFLRCIYPEDREAVKRAVEDAIVRGLPYNIEHRIVLPGGEVRLVHELGEVIYDAEGNPKRMLGTVQDITERKRTEAALRQRDLVLEAVAFAAERLVKTPDWTAALAEVLRRLGLAAGVDAVCLIERVDVSVGSRLPGGVISWSSGRDSESEPVSMALDLRAAGLGRWADLLSLGQLVQGVAGSFPESERWWFREHCIGSIVIVPILIGGEWWGQLCFQDLAERPWPLAETEALKTAALIIGAAIQREQAELAARNLAGEQAARLEAESSRERISEILESITAAFIAVAPSWQIRYVNREGEALLGRPWKELSGRKLWDVLPHAEDSAFFRQCRRALTEGVTAVIEEYYAPLGRWYEIYAYPGRDGLSLYFHDVTERRRAEEQLRISEARFAGILSAAAEAIITVDLSRRITLFNRGAEEIFGYTAEEVVGELLEVLIPERFRATHGAHVQTFRDAPERARYMGDRVEIRGIRKNGEEFPAEATISKTELAGEVALTVILRDVTERRRVEAALRQQNVALEILSITGMAASESRLEDAIARCIKAICTHLEWPVGLAYAVDTTLGLRPNPIWHLREPERHGTLRTRAVSAQDAGGAGLAARAIAAGHPVWQLGPPLSEESAIEQHARELGLGAGLAIPVMVGGKLAAVLEFFAEGMTTFSNPLLDLMAQVGVQLGQFVERLGTGALHGRG
jgi:PAS domain S-box-containing protein